ncbi:BspA family leucine-rich repeat surface protein [Lactococcus formosensis subsp. bovis]|uniref:BspA family leucine-rich repeat surface protein n=1 Tax=Lactococcus formosensis TaxID=1281486 RepID=UPI001BCF1D0B|nr:BspA family leucine-rich repeat surface protein [Lactococcus formosensis]
MKTKKNNKLIFISKMRQILTLAALVGLIGNSVLSGMAALATTLSPDVETRTEVESPLLDIKNQELLGKSEEKDIEKSGVIKGEEIDDSNVMESTFSTHSEVATEEVPSQTLEADLETNNSEAVPTQAMTVWGEVNAVWDSSSGTLTLTDGIITNPNFFGQQNNHNLRNAIEHIVFEGEITVGDNGSLFRLFFNMGNLEDIENLPYLNTGNATNMSDMFRFDVPSSLTELDLSSFNTSSVTNMSGMFWGADALIRLDVYLFDTRNVTTMQDMFSHTSALTEIKGLDLLDTRAVRDMEAMFRASGVNHLDLTSFDTREATNMAYMFAQMPNITALDLSSFETHNVTLMNHMFAISTNLCSINLSTFNTHQVRDMRWMFTSTHHLVNLDLSHFETENVTDMEWMFAGTRSLTALDLSNFNTRAVTNMDNMFWMATSLTELDLSSFKTPALTRMTSMFTDASALKRLDISSFDTMNVAVNNRRSLFQGLTSLVEIHLGANTNIINSALPNETTTPGFLNSWKRELQRKQVGWISSQDLMVLSENSDQAAGIWRRVPYQTMVEVKNSSLFVGESWEAKDNFISATNRFGEDVEFDQVTVEGDVDTDKAGTYKVTYAYDGVEATAEIVVKAIQTSVQVKDSSIFVGETWEAQDNFISATDRYGELVPFDRINVTGTVEIETAGTYKVTYAYDGVEEMARVTVKDRGSNGNGAPDGGESNNEGTESNNGNGTNGTGTSGEDDDKRERPHYSDNNEDEHKQTITDNLPSTGELGGGFGVLGLANLILAITLWLKQRKV